MAKSPSNGTDKKPRQPLKDRVLYMAYKGQLEGEPVFKFNRDELIDQMLEDRTLQVKKITIPRGTRQKKVNAPSDAPVSA